MAFEVLTKEDFMRNTDLGIRLWKGVDFFMTARMKPSCGAIRGEHGTNQNFYWDFVRDS